MNVIRLAFRSGVLGYRALFSWTSPALFVVALVLTPLLQSAFFVLLGRTLDYRDDVFFVIGNAVLGATAASVSGLVGVIAEERRFGTLTTIMASPASRVAIFVGRMLPGVVLAVGVSALVAAVGFTVVGWPFDAAATGGFSIVLVVAAFSGSAFGLVLSALGLIARDIFHIAGAAHVVLLLCTGANVALDRLPSWIAFAAHGLPLTNAIAAARSLLDPATTPSYAGHVLAEVLVGTAWLLLALGAMRLLERVARRSAALDLA